MYVVPDLTATIQWWLYTMEVDIGLSLPQMVILNCLSQKHSFHLR